MIAASQERLDTGEVRQAAEGRWYGEILPANGFDRDILDGRHHPCPKCGGTDRFRAIDPAAGAVICNQCFSEENGDGFAALMWLNNLTFPAARALVADCVNVRPKRPDVIEVDSDAVDLIESIARIKRIPLASFIAFGAIEAYRGNLKVVRLPMWNASGQQCSYCDFSEISPEFLKGMSAKKCPETPGVGLYYAVKPKPGDTVLVTEGPKDAAALHSLGYNSVGLPTSKLANQFARVFVGCHVILVPDLDITGEDSAPISASRLRGIATSVRIARLPGEIKKKDGDGVREVLAREGGEAKIREAIQVAKEWTPIDEQNSPDAQYDEWTSLATDKGRTDRANARRFLQINREKVRYCFEWEKWLVWDGTRWNMDCSGAVRRMAMSVGDKIWNDARPQLFVRDVVKFAIRSNCRGALSSMIELAAADVPVMVSELDANAKLLNCPNGVIDLKTGEFRAHRQEDNITKLCPTKFDPDATSYQWDRFLESIFDDELIIQYLQRFFGYCLTGYVSEQILSVLWGTGSNGKSTLLNAIRGTLGEDYSCAAPQSLLMQKQTEVHPTELATLFGKRLVIAQETDQGAKLAESTVKQLTGSDAISARRMREDFWTFTPSHKLLLATNHKPRIKGNDHAIWRRVVLIPFEKQFWNPDKGESGPPELEQKKQLFALLEAEKEGILAWMVRGCVEFHRVGLQIPDKIRAATSEYRKQEDCVGRFIEECCLLGDMYKVKFSDLYNALEKWCNESGDNLPSRKGLGQWLKDHEYEDKHSGSRWYMKIGLRDTEQTPESYF